LKSGLLVVDWYPISQLQDYYSRFIKKGHEQTSAPQFLVCCLNTPVAKRRNRGISLTSNPAFSAKPGFSVMVKSMLHFELFKINQVGLAIYRTGSATARPRRVKEKNLILF
jgi:hypothetical protein